MRSARWFRRMLVQLCVAFAALALGLVLLRVPAPAEAEQGKAVARHEPRDVGARFFLGGAALVGSGLIALALLVLWMFPDAPADQQLRGMPLAYPQPRLQTDPPLDMAAFRARQMADLNGTYWVDRGHGVVHIPIADAMRILAREGIPGWPGGAAR